MKHLCDQLNRNCKNRVCSIVWHANRYRIEQILLYHRGGKIKKKKRNRLNTKKMNNRRKNVGEIPKLITIIYHICFTYDEQANWRKFGRRQAFQWSESGTPRKKKWSEIFVGIHVYCSLLCSLKCGSGC